MAERDVDAVISQLESALDRAAAVELSERDEALIADVVGQAQGELPTPGAPLPFRSDWGRTGAIAAAVAVVASAATWVLVPRTVAPASAPIVEAPGKANEPPTPKRVPSDPSLARGAALLVGDGHACLKLERGITTCAADGGSVKVADPGPHLRLEVERGHVVARLEKLPPGTSFGLVTPRGEIVATGTTLSVDVSDDEVVFRVLEGSVVVRSGNEELRLEGPAGARHAAKLVKIELSDENRKRDLEVLAPSGLTVDGDGAEEPDAAGADAGPKKSAAELLKEARSARASGNLGAAAAKYQELMRSHPTSGEARAAHLSLADLKLAQGDAAGALQSYDAYLRSGGGLSPEARFGKIRALRALGRTGEEQAEIRRFLADYPNSAYASSLKKRLGSSGGAKKTPTK